MPQRNYSRECTNVAKPNKRVILPIGLEEYQELSSVRFRRIKLKADEKHVHFNGEKGYIATMVGDDCVLGASLALNADEAALNQAYSGFQEEARHLQPEYAPKTVNTDGWQATQNA